jgi:hypothetical protein
MKQPDSLKILTRRALLQSGLGAGALLAHQMTALAAAPPGFDQWRDGFRARALAKGISDATYTRVMGRIEPDMTVFKQMQKQPEFNEQIWQYLNRRVSDWRIIAGKEALKKNEALFTRIEPLLRYMGSDVTRCGDTGCGQVVKLINNTLVFEHVAALAEMMVVGERAGVAPDVLLNAVAKGSGDSFVLRNHGMKAMLPRNFPEKSFPPEYVLKDLGYTIELARSCAVQPTLPVAVQGYYRAAVEKGLGGRYFPAIIQLIEGN